MEKILGIGGFFFRSKDSKALAKWYQDHFGINPSPKTAEELPWRQEAGVTVFAPFVATSDYFGDPEKQWMINFRVRSIDAMVAQLRKAGIEVADPQDYPPVGKFARLKDPEGNPIELWEPVE